MTIWNDTILDSMVTELLKLLKRTRKDGPDKFNLAVRLSVKKCCPAAWIPNDKGLSDGFTACNSYGQYG